MISALGIRLFHLIVVAGNWVGTTHFKYKDNQIRVSKTLGSSIRYYFCLSFVLIAVPLALNGYRIYVDQHGFHMDDVGNIFKFFYCCVGAVLYVMTYTIYTKPIAQIIDQLLVFFTNIPEKYTIKSTSRNYFTPLFGALVLAGLTMPSMFVLIYLIRCDFHPFYDTFPIMCHLGDLENPVYKFCLKVIFCLMIWSLGTQAFFGAFVCLYPPFFFWFYGLELSSTLKKYEFHHRERTLEFLCIYKGLEILKYRINDTTGWFIPIYVFATFCMYAISFSAILKGKIDLMSSVGLIDVVFMFIAYYLVLQLSWRFLHSMTDILEKTKRQATGIVRKQIGACSMIVLDFAHFGHMNRDLYLMMGDLVIGNTINILLM